MNTLQSVGFERQSSFAPATVPDVATECRRNDGSADIHFCLNIPHSFPPNIQARSDVYDVPYRRIHECPIFVRDSEFDDNAPRPQSCPYKTLLDRRWSSPRELKLSDEVATEQVLRSIERKKRYRCLASRILANLIRKPRAFDKEYHNDYFDAIFASADLVFFCGRLAGHVRWEWSHHGEQKYDGKFLATTSLRRLNHGGLETLITLSRPILCSGVYDDKLVITTFLHELIHCYLFICCGENAAIDGGHTVGFKTIARRIDSWSATSRLRLEDTKANLSHFRAKPSPRLPSVLRNNESQVRICEQYGAGFASDQAVHSPSQVARPEHDRYIWPV